MTKKRKHTRAELTLCVFVVLAVFLAVVVMYYNQKTNLRVSREIHATLESYAQQQADHVRTVLSGQFDSLGAFASYLGQAGMEDTETFLNAADAIRQTQEFYRITMADLDGNGMTNEGIQRNIKAVYLQYRRWIPLCSAGCSHQKSSGRDHRRALRLLYGRTVRDPVPA